MSGVTIQIDTRPVLDLLQRLSAKLDDMTPVMQTIGEIVVNQVDEAFESGKSPAGVAWKPSRRALETGDKTLIDKNTLRLSLGVNAIAASAREVVVETNVPYAAIHQFGGVIRPKTKKALAFGGIVRSSVTIPARPFLPDDDSLDWAEIRATLWGYLQ
jgi:phage gpG-like protein